MAYCFPLPGSFLFSLHEKIAPLPDSPHDRSIAAQKGISMVQKIYMPGLDYIRVGALISVLLFHLFPDRMPGGFLGVEFFFVLTGFLLAVKDEPEQAESIVSFYSRKFRRLCLPVLFVLLLTSGLMAMFLPDSLYGLRGETLSAALGIYNWRQIALAQDYFAAIGTANPFTHLWTMSVEIQFLLLWPWLCGGIRRALKKDRESTVVLLGFGTISLSLLMPACYLLTDSVSFVYYSTLTRVFPLFLGALAGLSFRSGNPIGKYFMRIMKSHPPSRGLFLCANILVAAFLLLKVSGSDTGLYLGGMAAVSVWAAYLILIAAECPGLSRPGLRKCIRFFSAVSFEIYLWQYPVNFIFTGMFGNYIRIKIAELPVILALALWTYYLTSIEVKKTLWKIKNTLYSEKRRKEGGPAGSAGCC